ncbi:hypothetical protein GCM10025778_03810 [Paeniglutamicibacter antarcticus]|uniref:Uncharacterized protein n=1 Tax=Paeniglutamicibacter antarcticus TaxID=494023 RepID=A0ABP9THK1_9MICC
MAVNAPEAMSAALVRTTTLLRMDIKRVPILPNSPSMNLIRGRAAPDRMGLSEPGSDDGHELNCIPKMKV